MATKKKTAPTQSPAIIAEVVPGEPLAYSVGYKQYKVLSHGIVEGDVPEFKGATSESRSMQMLTSDDSFAVVTRYKLMRKSTDPTSELTRDIAWAVVRHDFEITVEENGVRRHIYSDSVDKTKLDGTLFLNILYVAHVSLRGIIGLNVQGTWLNGFVPTPVSVLDMIPTEIHKYYSEHAIAKWMA